MDMVGSRVERGVVHQLEQLFGHGTVTGLSEEQLLDRFATARDESAFEALVERHGPMVLGVCRQFLRDPNDVEDAFQATFLELVRKAGSLRQKDLLGDWLYPLEEILKHVKDATKGADGKRLSIYVDPQALQEAEKTMTSPVVIDLEDVPLRFSLRLVLKQLGLAYCVRDGVVMISTVGGIQQELNEAQAEQIGLNPDKFPIGGGAIGGGMGGMGGGRR